MNQSWKKVYYSNAQSVGLVGEDVNARNNVAKQLLATNILGNDDDAHLARGSVHVGAEGIRDRLERLVGLDNHKLW